MCTSIETRLHLRFNAITCYKELLSQFCILLKKKILRFHIVPFFSDWYFNFTKFKQEKYEFGYHLKKFFFSNCGLLFSTRNLIRQTCVNFINIQLMVYRRKVFLA